MFSFLDMFFFTYKMSIHLDKDDFGLPDRNRKDFLDLYAEEQKYITDTYKTCLDESLVGKLAYASLIEDALENSDSGRKAFCLGKSYFHTNIPRNMSNSMKRNLLGVLDRISSGTYGTVSASEELPVVIKNVNEDKEIEISSLIHEYVVGTEGLNRMRAYNPNFVYTLGYFDCGDLLSENSSYFCYNGENSPFVVIEHVNNSVPFIDFIYDHSYVEILEVLTIIMLALNEANWRLKFIHNDLHVSNVLVQTLKKPTCTRYKTKADGDYVYIKSKYRPVIIDYGFARFGDFNRDIYDDNIAFAPLKDVFPMVKNISELYYNNNLKHLEKLKNIGAFFFGGEDVTPEEDLQYLITESTYLKSGRKMNNIGVLTYLNWLISKFPDVYKDSWISDETFGDCSYFDEQTAKPDPKIDYEDLTYFELASSKETGNTNVISYVNENKKELKDEINATIEEVQRDIIYLSDLLEEAGNENKLYVENRRIIKPHVNIFLENIYQTNRVYSKTGIILNMITLLENLYALDEAWDILIKENKPYESQMDVRKHFDICYKILNKNTKSSGRNQNIKLTKILNNIFDYNIKTDDEN